MTEKGHWLGGVRKSIREESNLKLFHIRRKDGEKKMKNQHLPMLTKRKEKRPFMKERVGGHQT